MFFLLSKTLDLLITPIFWTMVLVLGGLIVGARWPQRQKLSRGLLIAAVVVLYAFSTAPVANRLEHLVEDDAPNTFLTDKHYDAVILLGGTVELLSTTLGQPPSYNDNSERLLVTWDLLRNDRASVAILSGGTVGGDRLSEASVLEWQLRQWGISSDRLVIEDQARNTWENAVFTKRIVEARGSKNVLIVTSAFHMRRAKECFNAAGLAVDALPVDKRVYDSARVGFNPMPRSDYLDESSDAIRELFGRVVYRVRGYAKPD